VPVNPELIQETSVSRTSSRLETSFSVQELQSRDHFPRSAKSSGATKGSSSSNTATVTCEAAAAIPYSTQKAAAAQSISSVTYWSTLSSSSTYNTNGGSNVAAELAHQFQKADRIRQPPARRANIPQPPRRQRRNSSIADSTNGNLNYIYGKSFKNSNS
jgi:hypothetical protein